jgi:hypothetical protein
MGENVNKIAVSSQAERQSTEDHNISDFLLRARCALDKFMLIVKAVSEVGSYAHDACLFLNISFGFIVSVPDPPIRKGISFCNSASI